MFIEGYRHKKIPAGYAGMNIQIINYRLIISYLTMQLL